MARDNEDKRRDRRDRRRQRSRSRSRDRSVHSRGREHRFGESSRRDYRNDDRRDRDRGGDRGVDRNEVARARERRKPDSPEPPRGNRFFDRARRLGIVPDTGLIAPPATATRIDPEHNSGPNQGPVTAASLAAARALALSASLTQSGASRQPGVAPGATALPNGTSVCDVAALAAGAVDPDVPSYYNPANVNTARIADQIKKRKMLWTRPGSEESKEAPVSRESTTDQQGEPGSSTIKYWANATFKGDDGKMTAKFRKLMGMKDGEVASPPKDSSKVLDEQDQLFKQLDLQYQAARATTHTQRGMGLGWGH